jgi:hypothetical protein
LNDPNFKLIFETFWRFFETFIVLFLVKTEENETQNELVDMVKGPTVVFRSFSDFLPSSLDLPLLKVWTCALAEYDNVKRKKKKKTFS